MTPLWNQSGRNLLTAALTSGSNLVWFNGTEVSDTATAWTAQTYANLTVGDEWSASGKYDGMIKSLKFYNALLTEDEHLNAYYQGGA